MVLERFDEISGTFHFFVVHSTQHINPHWAKFVSKLKQSKLAVCYCLHDDHLFLEGSIRSASDFGKVYAFISKVAWDGSSGEWKTAETIAASAGAEVIVGGWSNEQDHRQSALETLKGKGYRYVLTPDGDEVLEPRLLEALRKVAIAEFADRVFVHMDTYWKSAEYVIRPREQITPLMLVNVDKAHQVYIRHYEGGVPLILGPEFGVMHHLSYAGPDERIRRKLATWSHKDEVVVGWWNQVWQSWDSDHLMRNLHPTHPQAYGMAERIQVPESLQFAAPECRVDVETPKKWPTISVVIPLLGNPQDIRLCLESLREFRDLLHEVIVVDNGSTDGADEVAEGFAFVTLIRNQENRGYGPANNQGIELSTGEVLLLLNADAIVPRVALLRLIESLMASPHIGAAGPYTNECGHSQRIDPTYTSLDTLNLFAEDFAHRGLDDVEAPADMLVGFCLAVKRSVLDEVGGFDERFEIGSFEDNDLCYRVRRAGYRLVISTRSFVHHFGSRTFGRLRMNPFRILADNERKYREKWRDDLDTGFASHLSGLVNGQIVFDPNKSPERRATAIKPLAKNADISLCMIVRNEERVLGECLASAQPFFSQIVIVDTGSTDRTIEIAKQFGAEVHEIIWPESFSEARNESLRHARGTWVFWMDADDTLPWQCGEILLQNALQCPKEVAGFIVPVQFVEEGPGAGTRVDHVKLFRNHPNVQFEGRIHEQNLQDLRKLGEIARSSAFVLHSGYDTSVEGQRKKRERDDRLLKLDLQDRPNHPFVLFNLGMTAHFTGDHERAIDWLDKSLSVAEKGESHVRKAYALKATSQHQLGRSGEALSTIYRGLQEVGEDPELRFKAGVLLAEIGRLEEAREQYLAISTDIEGHFSSIDVGILGAKRSYNLAAISLQLGNYSEAKDWWLKALQENPNFLPSAMELFKAARDHGDIKTARQMLEFVKSVSGKGDDWVAMSLDLESSFGDAGRVEDFLRREIAMHPRIIATRLALAKMLLQDAREHEATFHLNELVKMGCAEAAFYLGVQQTRAGNFDLALTWMEEAHVLNPEHAQTVEQIQNLQRLAKSV